MKKLIVPLLALAAACRAEAKLTESQEYFMGRGVAAEAIAKQKIYKGDPALEEYVNLIGWSIALESDRPELFKGWTFGVLDNDDVNAFCGPSGFIFVTKGLLRSVQNEDELAGVLAHEIAHVSLRHPEIAAQAASQKSGLMEHAQNFQALAGLIGGILAASGKTEEAKWLEAAKEAAPVFGKTLGELNGQLQLGFNREEEMAADAKGADFMSRPGVGYNPQALRDFVARLPSKPQGAYATHPGLTDRVQKLDEAIRKLGKNIPTDAARTQRFRQVMAGLKGP
jgi:predicted Zn-dependent protease